MPATSDVVNRTYIAQVSTPGPVSASGKTRPVLKSHAPPATPGQSKGEEFFQGCMQRLDEAAALLQLEPEIHERLARPESMKSVNFPVQMDSGKVQFFDGYRCRYATARGPAKGGMRFSPGVDRGEVKALGFLMGIKCAILNV